MDSYGTNEMEAFSAKAIQIFYQTAIADKITNSDYEGDLKGKGSRMNILTFGEITEKNYTGANLTADDVEESEAQLVTDQQKAFYFKIKSIDQFKSYIKSPEGTILAQVANRLKYLIDSYVLGLYGDVAAGHRVGTDYSTGTVTVDVTTGAVTGSGTTFTAAMVGRGFKADGHTKWYRVKTFTDTTHIVIENDSDDNTSEYDGGAIAGGSSYVIEAATAVQVTKDNIYAKLTTLRAKLDNAEIPGDNRWLVVSPEVEALIIQAPEYTPAVTQAYEEVIKRGYVGMIAGFDVYKASDGRLGGNSTDGWHLMAGHKMGITMAMGDRKSVV